MTPMARHKVHRRHMDQLAEWREHLIQLTETTARPEIKRRALTAARQTCQEVMEHNQAAQARTEPHRLDNHHMEAELQ